MTRPSLSHPSTSPSRRTEIAREMAAARTAALTPARRTEIARIAARARWSTPRATKPTTGPGGVALLLAEIQTYRQDLREAAGECLVDPPAPGSNLARVVHANALLRAEVARHLDRAVEAETSLRAAEALLRDILAGLQRDRTVSLLTERRIMTALGIQPISLKDAP